MIITRSSVLLFQVTIHKMNQKKVDYFDPVTFYFMAGVPNLFRAKRISSEHYCILAKAVA